MSTLNDFIDEDRTLIVSMPVRVGFWMSYIDDDPTSDRDDQKEALALEKALKMIVSKTDDARFINDVCEFALVNKAEWAGWADNAGTALADLPKALKKIEDTLTAKDLKDYKSAIYRIAGVVAQAAGEFGNSNKPGLFGGLFDGLSVKTDMSTPENVSATEKAALQKLLACLKGQA
jgi:hypothetical protein